MRDDLDGELAYSFQPSAFGAPRRFRLTQYALEWEIGHRSGRIPFGRITRVRMSYRPATLQSYRFITEIWSSDTPKLDIVSTSWKSMVEQASLANEYGAFIVELHRRLAAAESRARFEAGMNALIYWPGLAVFAGAAIGLAGLTVQAIAAGAGLGGLLIAVFLALFLWQLGNIFRRNRPAPYRPDALPPLLLPRPAR